MRNAHHWSQIREEIILLCVQWYVSYPLTYTELKTVMEERGFKIDSNTINNLVTDYAVLAKKRWLETQRKHRKGWRVVQIPFYLQGRKKYLYRALDAQGNTLDFMISARRNKEKAQLFFAETISNSEELNTEKLLYQKRPKRRKENKFLASFIYITFLVLSGYLILSVMGLRNNNNQEENQPNNQVLSHDRKNTNMVQKNKVNPIKNRAKISPEDKGRSLESI